MEVPIPVIAFTGFIILVFIYAMTNLLRKNEKLEDSIVEQNEYISELNTYVENASKAISENQKHLQNLDDRGIFQSDDEVGYFFEQLKVAQEDLNRFIIRTNEEKTKKEE